METLSKIFESLEKKNKSIKKDEKKQTVLNEKQNKLKISRINRVVEALNAKQSENRKKTISESVSSLKKNIAASKKLEALSRRRKFEALIRDAQEEKERKEKRAAKETTVTRECGRRLSSSAGKQRFCAWDKDEWNDCRRENNCRRENRRFLRNNESGIEDIENAKRRFFSDLEDGDFEESLRERRLRERRRCRESLTPRRFRRR